MYGVNVELLTGGTWSAFDVSKGGRTIAEIESLCRKPKTRLMGCCREPFFKFIPIERVMIDTLHLFLRISGYTN